jgi:hypothetical protein
MTLMRISAVAFLASPSGSHQSDPRVGLLSGLPCIRAEPVIFPTWVVVRGTEVLRKTSFRSLAIAGRGLLRQSPCSENAAGSSAIHKSATPDDH